MLCIYVCMYVCMLVCVWVCVCLCAIMHVWLYICMFVCVRTPAEPFEFVLNRWRWAGSSQHNIWSTIILVTKEAQVLLLRLLLVHVLCLLLLHHMHQGQHDQPTQQHRFLRQCSINTNNITNHTINTHSQEKH